MEPSAKRILVVDDEPDIRQLISAILEEEGYRVDAASGGRDAVARVRARPPDLMILDLHMPDLDGKGVIQQLANLPAPPPVLILTGQTNVELAPLHPFVAGFLTKPFRVDILLRTCANILSAPPLEGQFSDRRRQPRRRITLDATVLSQEGTPVALGRLLDVSVAGAQLDLGAPLQPGHDVNIALQVPGVDRPVMVRGSVVWRDASKVGISFQSLGPEEERHLRELVAETESPPGSHA